MGCQPPSIEKESGEALVERINRMHDADELEKLEFDVNDDGTTDLVFWCRDGSLLKLIEPQQKVVLELDLPPFDSFNRIAFRSGALTEFVVDAPGERALFYHSLKMGSVIDRGDRSIYFDTDGQERVFTGTGRRWVSTRPNVLVFLKGERKVFSIEISSAVREYGVDFKTLLPGSKYKKYFENKVLSTLINQYLAKREPTQ